MPLSYFHKWWQRDENTIDGFRYVVKHGQKESQEKFRLRQRDGEICFLIIGTKTASSIELKINYVDQRMAVFENPAKTFPKFIRYKLKPNGELEVIADGERRNGKSYRVQYPFTKVS